MKSGFIFKNIKVIDPVARTITAKNLCINEGIYQETADHGVVIDMSGYYLSPGLIDLHMHTFAGQTPLGIEADRAGIRQGVLTVIDAGSTGIRDYDSFKAKVIEKSITKVKFFLNIARQGLCDGLSELADRKDLMTLAELKNFKQAKGEALVGLKVRMSASVVRENGIEPLKHARRLADETKLPLMVHIGNAPPALSEVLKLLRKGDILTHCFHGKAGGLCDNREEFINAVNRGVHFDVGHGNASFSYHTMDRVLALNKIDYSISTDIYNSNFDKPVGSLMQTMSKFLASGLPLEEIIYKVTALPAQVLGLPIERPQPGADANCTIFKLRKKPKQMVLLDAEGVSVPAEEIFTPVMTIKNGKRVWEGNV